jgi:hypothetical protein
MRLISGLTLFLGILAGGLSGEPLPASRGQSPATVRANLGPPLRVSRQILFGRHIEQWAYDEPRPLRVEFNAVRGQEPFACAILQLSPGRP